MKKITLITLITACLLNMSCEKFLDVVPDNVATIDHAFSDKITTERYLITCYAGLPPAGVANNPAFFGGDEFWSWNILPYTENPELVDPFRIGRGEQTTNEPYLNYYEGSAFKTIRKCNTFLERVDAVPDIEPQLKEQWKAEAKVIKANVMLVLMKMYGPIPVIYSNLPISATPEEVRYKRSPWNEGIDHIISLLDEAIPLLLPKVLNRQEDLGRINKMTAMMMKVETLMLTASPQFNGNPYYATWVNKDGEKLFGPYDLEKWKSARDAAKEGLDYAKDIGHKLYVYTNELENIPIEERSEYTYRGMVSDELWNNELIWTDINNSSTRTQQLSMPYLDGRMVSGGHIHLVLNVNMKVANQFYTSNGLPVEEDKTWIDRNATELRAATVAENGLIKGITANVNFDREPRYYGSVGFDRGVWYGNGKGNDQSGLNPWIIMGLKGQAANKHGTGERSNVTGYFAKKLINKETSMRAPSTFTAKRYPFPLYRLAELYLWYSEAINEYEGPTQQALDALDVVRKRSQLKGVAESWTQFSTKPGKFNSRDGFRDIIQRERLIELAFEGKRFWDLRRWLLSEKYLNQDILGWNVNGETEESYYSVKKIFNQSFTPKDYLWPIRQYALTVNTNLVQAPGW